MDDQEWIIAAGDVVVEKKVAHGFGGLTVFEQILYCLWVTDYSICNAGDLTTIEDVFPSAILYGLEYSSELGLKECLNLFASMKDNNLTGYSKMLDAARTEIEGHL